MIDGEPALPRRLVASLAGALVLPLVIWMAVSFAAPVLAGAGGGPRVLAWLDAVERAEAAQSAILAPRLASGADTWCAAAWPYARSRALVDRWLPEDQPLFVAAVRSDDQRMLARIQRGGERWLDERLVPMQRRWCAAIGARLWLALDLLLLAAPACVLAYALGEWRSRLHRERGLQPLGHRYRAWAGVARAAVWLLPTCIVAPVPMPSALALGALLAVLVLALAGARSHALEL